MYDTIFLKKASDYFFFLDFTLISDPDINIGLIRLMLKRSGDELKEILDGFLSDIHDPGPPRDPGSASEAALVNF